LSWFTESFESIHRVVWVDSPRRLSRFPEAFELIPRGVWVDSPRRLSWFPESFELIHRVVWVDSPSRLRWFPESFEVIPRVVWVDSPSRLRWFTESFELIHCNVLSYGSLILSLCLSVNTPHFLHIKSVEVNARQTATFQCTINGQPKDHVNYKLWLQVNTLEHTQQSCCVALYTAKYDFHT